MNVQKFNISKPEEYTDRQGQVKTKWNNVGFYTEFHKDDGSVSRKVEIPAIGLDAQVFPFQDRNDQAEQQYQNYGQQPAQPAPQTTQPLQSSGTAQPQQWNQQGGTQEINPDDIPF